MWACGTEQWTSAQTLILSFTGILLSSTVCEVRFQILAIWHWEKIKSRKSLHSRNLHFSDCIWAWSLDPACLGLSSYTSCLPFLSLYSFVVVNLLSPVWLSATPWTVAHQASLCMGFSRQEYWSGLPFPSPLRGKETHIGKYSHWQIYTNKTKMSTLIEIWVGNF